MPRRVKVEGDLFHGRIPASAVYIGRAAPGLPASLYANPFTVKEFGLDLALHLYRVYLAIRRDLVEQARREIGDQDVACWCALSARCHGDPLLEAMAGV